MPASGTKIGLLIRPTYNGYNFENFRRKGSGKHDFEVVLELKTTF